MADPIELLIQGRAHELGPGFPVRRVLPSVKRRVVGPFIFLDHFGPMTVPPGGDGMSVRPHPHIGLATVSYLFEGGIFHRDSLGYAQAIRPGDVNWMTAGSGIAHSERTEDEMKRTIDAGGTVLTPEDETYPERLREIYDPPAVLWIRGDVGQLGRPGIASYRSFSRPGSRSVIRESCRMETIRAGLLFAVGRETVAS